MKMTKKWPIYAIFQNFPNRIFGNPPAVLPMRYGNPSLLGAACTVINLVFKLYQEAVGDTFQRTLIVKTCN